MKRLFLFLSVIVLAIANPSVSAGQQEGPAKVVVYYFHGSFRCVTCTNMEKYSQEAIETNFKDALASEKLEFKVVNVEDKGNEHFVNDYRLYTKTLIVSLVINGKEIKSKNLDKIWEYVRNKQKFIAYITEEVGKFLEEAK